MPNQNQKVQVELSAEQAEGLQYVVDQRNKEIGERNAARETRNDNLKEDETPESLEEEFTLGTYLAFITNSYAAEAKRNKTVDIADKIERLSPERRKEVEAIFAKDK